MRAFDSVAVTATKRPDGMVSFDCSAVRGSLTWGTEIIVSGGVLHQQDGYHIVTRDISRQLFSENRSGVVSGPVARLVARRVLDAIDALGQQVINPQTHEEHSPEMATAEGV